ncbi:MAG: hypothetical protein OXC61_09710 [Flavobacteriaceae bacterium]|nr:hypothetical protein [Flavobacteriaceae bacterium]
MIPFDEQNELSMSESEVLFMGYTTKKFSYKGELLIQIKYPDLNPFLNLRSLFIDIDHTLVPHQIEKLKTHSKNQIRVKFLGVDNELNAHKLLFKQVYVLKTAVDLNIDTSEDLNHLVGYGVYDQTTKIGTIKNIIERPLQPLLEIAHDGFEFLIPLDTELILQEDQRNQKLTMKLPEGLIDLNNSN